MKVIKNTKNTKIVVDIFMTIFLGLSFIRWEDPYFIFHAMVGLLCALFFALHLTIHWKWLKAVTKSLFAKNLNKALKGKYIIDILLLVVWVVAIFAGILAIGDFLFEIEEMAVFGRIHGVATRVGLGLVVVHGVQHVPQIRGYLKRG